MFNARMIAAIALLLLTKYAKSGGGDWDYVHMDEWVEVNDMCGTNDQSPINIKTNDAVYDSTVCGSYLNWTVNHNIHAFKVSNNGHSVVLQPAIRTDWASADTEIEGADVDSVGRTYTTLTSKANSIGKLPNYFAPDDSPHKDGFCLHSFHFHWGLNKWEGSEHLIDRDAWPLEVHFVHYSCARDNLGGALGPYPDTAAVEEATDAGDDVHELAVVGIMFEITDEDNPAFDLIFGDDAFEDIEYPGSYHIVDGVYLQDLIPRDVWTAGYYSYEGSLTTPPCTPIVRWHVSNAKSYIGRSQMAKFRQLMLNANETSAPNFREPQTNINTVYACMEEEVDTDTSSTKAASSSTTEDMCRPFCDEYYCGNQVQRDWQTIVWFLVVSVVVITLVISAVVYYRMRQNERAQIETAKYNRNRVMSTSVDPAHGIQSNAAHHQKGAVTNI